MKKIKILFVHHGVGWGGAPISLLNLIKKIDKNKFEPQVLLLKDSIVSEKFTELNIPFTICNSTFYKNWYKYFTHSDASPVSAYKILKITKLFVFWVLNKYVFAPNALKNLNFDIIHLNSSVLSDWVYPASKKGKVIYHVREPISKGWFGIRYNFIRREVAKYADKVIAISKDNAARINIPTKTEVVYNFISIPKKIKRKPSTKTILYVGGAAKIKGIEVLIKAIPYINKDIKLNLAGHFPHLKPLGKLKKLAYKLRYPSAYKLRKQLAKIASRENVHILGAIPSITNELEKCTLLISPFTVPHFSRPVIEAFSYEKPVIASNVLGMDEIVEDGIDGLLFENGDAKALAKAINILLNNPDLVTKMGKKGRNKALEFYAPETNTNKIERIYLELMGRN